MKKYRKYPKRLLANEDQYYAFGEVWVTLDRQTIPLVNLKPKHLEKIIEHVKNRNLQGMLPFLQAELKRRKEEKLAKRTKMGKVLFGVKHERK